MWVILIVRRFFDCGVNHQARQIYKIETEGMHRINPFNQEKIQNRHNDYNPLLFALLMVIKVCSLIVLN